MKYKWIYPSTGTANAALSVCFLKSELLSAGLKEDAIDFDPQYIGKTEFRKLFDLWEDPMYLADFFEENEEFFRVPFWEGITEEMFVRDVVLSSRIIFQQVGDLIKNGRLLEVFESLDEKEDIRRIQGRTFKVKAKYGYISHRMAFRFYGVLLDRNTICITGGAIKIVHEMKDAPNTDIELKKMELVVGEFNANGVFDKESFIDFITE